MPKAMLLFIGLLVAGAISFAQEDGGSYVMPDAPDKNFFLEAGAGYMRAENHTGRGMILTGNNKNFYGRDVSIGFRPYKAYKAQISVGSYSSSDQESQNIQIGDFYIVQNTVKHDIRMTPILTSHSWCIPVTPGGRCEIRLTPVFGMLFMKLKWTESLGYKSSIERLLMAVGAGVGFTHHFSTKFYLDSGYRFLLTEGARVNFDGRMSGYLNSLSTHRISVAFGWKF